MTSEQRRRARALFDEALSRPAESRRTWLSGQSGEEGAVVALAGEMLEALDQAGDFLKDSTIDVSAVAGLSGVGPELQPGDRVGPYRLIESIGEGGFGSVFRAEQERPIRREVALKVIKLGMDTRRVIARFEAERQALALMDHPNIARVLDAGSTPAGRPYFVMELVRGTPITWFCDEHRLSPRERLALFRDVCNAVHHAHTKGLIHRDIKPSNILVAAPDGPAGRPVPRIIDFGIAKATGGGGGEGLTEAGAMLGTPEYMSPEQAGLNADDVDTRSDIYSLGVVLYELLTGLTPFDAARLRSGSFADMQRLIRDVDPPTPSDRVRTAETTGSGGREKGPTPEEIADRRGLTLESLRQTLRGELDWIVMRALAKDRSRRYSSARELADDLDRSLSDRPVLAGPASRTYLARKFVARNKLAVGAAGAVSAALLVGSGALAVGLLQARSARDAETRQREAAERSEREAREAQAAANASRAQAELSLARAQTTVAFLKSVLGAVSPEIAQGRDTTLLRETLVRASARAESDLASQPGVLAEMLELIGVTYRNAALHNEAVSALTRAMELRRRETPPDPAQLARTSLELGMALRAAGSLKPAAETLDSGIALARGATDATPRLLGDLLRIRADVAAVTAQADPGPFIEESIAVLGAAGDERGLAQSRVVLASVLRQRGEFDRSAEQFGLAIDTFRRFPDARGELAGAINSLATMVRQRGDTPRAIELFREALEIRRTLYDRPHPDVAVLMVNLGNAYLQVDRADEAEPILREAVRMHHEIYKGNHMGEAMAIDRLARTLSLQNKTEEALTLHAAALEIFQRTVGVNHPMMATAYSNLGLTYMDADRVAEAEEQLRRSDAIYSGLGDRERMPRNIVRGQWARALLKLDRPQEALDVAEEARTVAAGFFKPSDMPYIQVAISVAVAKVQLGRVDEGMELYRELVRSMDSAAGARQFDRVNARAMMGRALLKVGQFAGAEALFRESLALSEGMRDPRGTFAIDISRLMAALYESWNQAEPDPAREALAREWSERAQAAAAGNSAAPR